MRKGLLLRPAVIAVVIAAVVVHYPCVKGIQIHSVDKQRSIWTITGTITINPQEAPEELCYNRHPHGFLPWWEAHINEVLAQRGFPVRVLTLDLWFESTSETEDVIGFRVEYKMGQAKVVQGR